MLENVSKCLCSDSHTVHERGKLEERVGYRHLVGLPKFQRSLELLLDGLPGLRPRCLEVGTSFVGISRQVVLMSMSMYAFMCMYVYMYVCIHI